MIFPLVQSGRIESVYPVLPTHQRCDIYDITNIKSQDPHPEC